MRVKICGLCRPQDASDAASAGAKYLGVILTPHYPRSRSLIQAGKIFGAAEGPARVGVFVDPTPAEVLQAISVLMLDVVQLHGAESPLLIREIGPRASIWKAVRVRTPNDLVDGLARFNGEVDGVLVDAATDKRANAESRPVDWQALQGMREALHRTTFILAGGLVAENVRTAIELLAPDVVDVSSGVERRLGEKDAQLMEEFIRNARDSYPDSGAAAYG